MRKLIRFSAAAFLVWAVTTFVWASISHVTGVTGPARASGATLDFVASAVTFLDPPGVLGDPQRLAARQIRQLARTVERIQRGPERLSAELIDEMGHRRCHARHAHLHLREHRRVHEIRIERDGRAVLAPIAPLHLIDELDAVRAHAETQAVIGELQERQRERIEQSLERVRARIESVQAGQESALSPKVKERLREVLRRLERELGDAAVAAAAPEADGDGAHRAARASPDPKPVGGC